MFRNVSLSICLLLCGAQMAFAQDWAKRLFKEFEHDFGTVARGAKVEHRGLRIPQFVGDEVDYLSLIHISEPTRPVGISRMPSSA